MQAELPEGFVKHDICVIIYIHVKIRRVYRKEEKQKNGPLITIAIITLILYNESERG
jgi:hypothetical protein